MAIEYSCTVYLGDLKYNEGYAAVRWLAEVMPYSEGRWRIRELAFVDFVHETDATFFRLRWS